MNAQSILFPKALGGRLVFALAAMAAVMAIQAIFGASPALALTERPDDTYMTNGKVYATALSEDGKTLYLGGDFSEVRHNPHRKQRGGHQRRDRRRHPHVASSGDRGWRRCSLARREERPRVHRRQL